MLAAAAGCGRDPRPDAFELTDVTGAPFGRELALTDHEGRARTLADFRGKAVAVFFGYTSCPDVCPTVLAELAQVMRELGPLAAEVQVLFVTVDPERDTPEALARYVRAFHPSFVALHGDPEAIARTAKEFRLYYHKQPLASGGYTVDHGAGIFLYDRQGRLRLFAQYGRDRGAIARDLRRLLAS